MADTSSIFSNNTIYMNDLKDKTLSALTHLEEAALSIGFSWTTYVDQIVPLPTGEYKLLDPALLESLTARLDSIGGIDMKALPDISSATDIEKYHDHVWSASQMDTLQEFLSNYLNTLGMPDQKYQDSIFNYGKERVDRAFNDGADLLAAKHSGRGYKYANGMLNADLLKLAEDHNNALYDQSRKIEELMVNWAKDNLHFAIQQGIAVEQAHMDFAYRYSSIYREVMTMKYNLILEEYKAALVGEGSKIEAVVQAVAAQAAMFNANATIEGKRDTAWLEKAKTEITQSLGKFASTITELTQTNAARLGAFSAYGETVSKLVNGATNTVLGVVTKKET
jgi:hypothetical protein